MARSRGSCGIMKVLNYFKCFERKLIHSRSVSLKFHHFLFCIGCNFGIPTPCKISLQSLSFLCG